jgi:hypothetical protein
MLAFSAGLIADREVSTLPDLASGGALIILPTLNEREGLAKTLTELEGVTSFPPGRIPRILVVDGHSTDGTLVVAEQHGCSILIQHGRGKGAAIREGLRWSTEHHFEMVGVLDADATYPSDRLPALFELLSLGADVVVGIRRPDHPSLVTARDLVHRIGNGGLNLTAALFSRGPILDVCSGFWGLRTALLPRLALVSDGFEIESELFVKSFRMGLRVVQIPVSYRERTGIAKLQAGRDGIRIFLSIIRQSHAAVQLIQVRTMGTAERASPGMRARVALGLPALVLALALTLNPGGVRITSSPQRRVEAVEIATRLEGSGVGVELVTDSGLHVPPPPRHLDDTDAPAPAVPLRPAPLDVALPDDASLEDSRDRTAIVAVPRSSHLLRLGDRDRSRPALRLENGNTPVPLRRESVRPRGPGVVRILSATLDTSGVQKDIALLAANFSMTGFEIYRPHGRAPEAGADAGRSGSPMRESSGGTASEISGI